MAMTAQLYGISGLASTTEGGSIERCRTDASYQKLPRKSPLSYTCN